MRSRLLRLLYNLFPFDLRGDCTLPSADATVRISCVINFYGRIDLLRGIMYSLTSQDYPKDLYEVVLVEDRGGTDEGRGLADSFKGEVNIVYTPLDHDFGKMGTSRNHGLAASRGEIILFLDDDTVILQQDFLSLLDSIFTGGGNPDAVIPRGRAAWSCMDDRYDYHDPYFMTSRCTAYRRGALIELGGFVNDFFGQEDVEFVTRFTISEKRAMKSPLLEYFHPPLLVPTTRKPRAVGYSFFRLKNRYSFPIWIMLLLNCSRHAPLYLFPSRKCREQGRFGIGFLLGILDGLTGKKGQVYG